ncbi:MAG: DoxX family protein [Terriglobales bacterium]
MAGVRRFLGVEAPAYQPDDWIARGAIALFFLMFGLDKFSSDPHSEWVEIFRKIGLGMWFRTFTGWVEIAGAALVLVPRMAMLGLTVLAATMAGAAAAWIFRLGEPGTALVPGFLMVLVALAAGVRWVELREERDEEP